MTRRQFLYYSALATAGASALGSLAAPAPRKLAGSDKLRLACVGGGGKGASDIKCCGTEEIVAICDLDRNLAADSLKAFPKAKFYVDWREMLEKEENNIDAVTVSTPDHLHGLVTAASMRLGKHVYCQKPLCQTVYESRYLRKLAKAAGVVTQMGNQGGAADGFRRAVEVIQAGVIGHVRQIHAWTDRPIWPQGVIRPPGADPVPAEFRWDLWLGPAPERPFKSQWPAEGAGNSGPHGSVYHPFVWRGWFDFGTGALGDMACHTVSLPFRAARLGYPKTVELLDHSELNSDTYPKSSRIRFLFPAREGLPETELLWYDGNPRDKSCRPYRPPEELTNPIKELNEEVPGCGCLFVGDKGQLYSPDAYGTSFFLMLNGEKELVKGDAHEAAKDVPHTVPRNAFKGDLDYCHHQEWIAACKGGPTPYSNFDISAYLTETILLGCVALRVGKPLSWDGPNMRALNTPEAERFIKRENRKGWNLA
jgi:hypothetical protein